MARKKFWLSTPEEKRKALERTWKLARGDTDVVMMREKDLDNWRMDIWLAFDVQLTNKEIFDFWIKKINGE